MARKDRKKFLNDLEFNSSLLRNRASYIQYYDRLTDIGINCFKWKNLPDSVDERFLELALFETGMSVFFDDDVLGYLALQTKIGGKLDVYRIPIDRTAYASNGYNHRLTKDDSVLIWNNRMHTPSKLDVEIFAQRLYNLDRTIDVNVNAQKTPVVILCDEKQRLTMKNLYMQYEGNEPFIFGGKDLDLNDVKVLNTGAPYVSDKLYELKQKIWNEAMTYLGVANTETKKERMITGEVERAMGGVYASRLSRLNARKEACEKINKMFGLNIDVEYNTGLDTDMNGKADAYEDGEGDEE